MTLQQLKYIITISETGSLNRAAEMLYISQPSLTSAVKELEKEVGITIFNRGGRGVTLTNDGAEFLLHAKMVYGQYEDLASRYGKGGNIKKKFGISAQHYSFAVKAFVEMVKHYDIGEYDFAVRETKTIDVIDDVAGMRSEIGILYLSDFNRQFITKILAQNNLEFHKVTECSACAYICKNHPLAKQKSVTFEDLAPYPCLTFEQGDNSSFYFAEEIYLENEYPKIIKVCDRATVLNLMVGVNGYIVCSGIICEELSGDDYISIPISDTTGKYSGIMEIGYILRKNSNPSKMANLYIDEMKSYLKV